jgi:hypothetical protein
MVSGIRVVQHWAFSKCVSPINLTSLFKIVLSNVHRQSEQAYIDSSVSTVEMPNLNWFLVSSIFVFQMKRQSIYYSVGLIFDFQKFPSAPGFLDVVISCVKTLANVAKGLLALSQPLTRMTKILDVIRDDLAVVLQASIPSLPPLDLSALDSVLYSRLLTSLFETHMTIVVESAGQRPEHAQQLAGFLLHFCLPYQRQFSTLDLLPRASPHLSVQCIAPQSQGQIQDLMLMFDRPVTSMTAEMVRSKLSNGPPAR